MQDEQHKKGRRPRGVCLPFLSVVRVSLLAVIRTDGAWALRPFYLPPQRVAYVLIPHCRHPSLAGANCAPLINPSSLCNTGIYSPRYVAPLPGKAFWALPGTRYLFSLVCAQIRSYTRFGFRGFFPVFAPRACFGKNPAKARRTPPRGRPPRLGDGG